MQIGLVGKERGGLGKERKGLGKECIDGQKEFFRGSIIIYAIVIMVLFRLAEPMLLWQGLGSYDASYAVERLQVDFQT